MKEIIKRILASEETSTQKVSVVREYLQARILQILQADKAFLDWIFCGGTSLRFLYQLSRYSEDLDFALNLNRKNNSSNVNSFTDRMSKIKNTLERESYEIEVKAKSNRTVNSAFISFVGLLFELGLSPYPNQKLSIKIDLDTNPPLGGICESTVVRNYLPINLFHYNKASLLSGKIHALLNRSYTKARDIYDLIWYISDPKCPLPNFVFLNNALQQTGWTQDLMTEGNWKTVLLSRLDSLDWKQAKNDVEPFLERTEDIEMISKDVVRKLLRGN